MKAFLRRFFGEHYLDELGFGGLVLTVGWIVLLSACCAPVASFILLLPFILLFLVLQIMGVHITIPISYTHFIGFEIVVFGIFCVMVGASQAVRNYKERLIHQKTGNRICIDPEEKQRIIDEIESKQWESDRK